MPSLSPSNHWQQAESYHHHYHALLDMAEHYRLYADLYLRLGQHSDRQTCLSKAQDLQSLAEHTHTLEQQHWQQAHHHQLSHRLSRTHLRQGFGILASCYLCAWGGYLLVTACHLALDVNL